MGKGGLEGGGRRSRVGLHAGEWAYRNTSRGGGGGGGEWEGGMHGVWGKWRSFWQRGGEKIKRSRHNASETMAQFCRGYAFPKKFEC